MKYNILYIHSHDTGRYIEPYGHLIPTPNLKRLAKEGVIFRKSFSTAPTCSPSRASFLTGQYPHNNGQYGLVNRGFELPDTDKHIVNLLKEEKYHNILIGMQHIRKNSDSIGYNQVVDVKDNYEKNVTPAAVNYIKDKIRAPFFLSVGYEETHRPFHSINNEDDPKYTDTPKPIPDTKETRQDMAAFKASAGILDQGIGSVIAALKNQGFYEKTIIIYTTDHGIAFPGMKCTLTDHGTGVALIIRAPKYFKGGQVMDALVSHIDVYPTICDLIEVDKPMWLQGKSLLPLIVDGKKEVNNEIFAEVNYHTSYEPMRSVRTKRWKYIRRFRNRTKPFLSNTDESPSKELWVNSGWQNSFISSEELYDLILDPNEANNLISDHSKKDILKVMRDKLDNWMKKTNDPLCKGQVPKPEKAVVSDDEDQKAEDIWNYTDQPEEYH